MSRDYYEEIARLDASAETLTDSLGNANTMTVAFESELKRLGSSMQSTGVQIAGLEKGLSRGLRKAFDGVIFDGMKLSDALETVANSMINTAYNAAVKPVTDQLGGMLARGVNGLVGNLLPFADGGSFSQGRVMPFASGGIVSEPTQFPMRGGMGLMGEAGPEAIMPLSRGADGKLGVRAAGGQGAAPTVVMNISTPDVQSFARSRGQIAAQMTRALGRGNRNT